VGVAYHTIARANRDDMSPAKQTTRDFLLTRVQDVAATAQTQRLLCNKVVRTDTLPRISQSSEQPEQGGPTEPGK
jgi:hypothetical protein